MRAVKVMINVLVPTAGFNSIPRKTVKTTSIIIPPPVPTNPVPNPIVIPKNRETAIPFQSSFSPFEIVPEGDERVLNKWVCKNRISVIQVNHECAQNCQDYAGDEADCTVAHPVGKTC